MIAWDFNEKLGSSSGADAAAAVILLPTVVMLLLIAIRMRVDTQIHLSQPIVCVCALQEEIRKQMKLNPTWIWARYIQKGMFVEVGKGISPHFEQVLELL
ncbi:unnamed protein product [Prunus armeniaca]|uniref:Uncharacterized protein n=1 Tax=Prunus armeniaca TaxID=36596 RepID=A0A6J5XVQ3_PRUAR|nr:unnamed protein product [Prunus armeniaca]